MFQFPRWPICFQILFVAEEGFPHSDILGSQAVRRFPEAFRRRTTSFVGTRHQGIHRLPLSRQAPLRPLSPQLSLGSGSEPAVRAKHTAARAPESPPRETFGSFPHHHTASSAVHALFTW